MNDFDEIDSMSTDAVDRDSPCIPKSLTSRVERLRVLSSAWAVLAPAGIIVAGQNLGETGRVFSVYLAELMARGHEPDAMTLADVDARLAELSTMMHEVAGAVATSQLRTSLPDSIAEQRAGVLDLLDLLIEGGDCDANPISSRLASIDFLVTLLCTGGKGHTIRHDPVTLTPSLEAFCAVSEAQAADDPRVDEVASEFLSAANLSGEQLHQELALRRLCRRKISLGPLYFAPRVLRAIMTYNAVLAERMADEVWNSINWGGAVEQATPAAVIEPTAVSVFESKALCDVAAALGRRAASEAPESNDLDRVAWSLDLDELDKLEQKMLLRAGTGKRENVLGTTILIGLISRSLAEFSVELQSIGISPDQVSDQWPSELDEVLQSETNAMLAKDLYQQARIISGMRTKFLSSYLTSTSQQDVVLPRPPAKKTPPPKKQVQNSADTARELVRDALEQQRTGQNPQDRRRRGGRRRGDKKNGFSAYGASDWQWKHILSLLVVLATIGYGLLSIFGGRLLDPDLQRFSGRELDQVSPYLTNGYRSGEGTGEAFVGTLANAWLVLPQDVRVAAAEDLVALLRVHGMRQIMIYDDDEQLRIQAVGKQPIQSF